MNSSLMRLCALPSFYIKIVVPNRPQIQGCIFSCPECLTRNTSMPLCPVYQILLRVLDDLNIQYINYEHYINNIKIKHIEFDETNYQKSIGQDNNITFTIVLIDETRINYTTDIPLLYECNCCGNSRFENGNYYTDATILAPNNFRLLYDVSEELE
jgi:hypothetical protein